MKSINLVLFGGIPSSGTTLLSVLLDNHPEISCGPEVALLAHDVLWKSFTKNKDDLIDHINGVETNGGLITWSNIDDDALSYYGHTRTSVIELVESSSDMTSFVKGFFGNLNRRSSATLNIEKSPQNLFGIDSFLLKNRAARAIVMVRDSRGVIPSLIKRGQAVELATAIWVHDATIAFLLKRKYQKRVCLVRYEDLIDSPEAELARICNFLRVAELGGELMRVNLDRSAADSTLTKGAAAGTWHFNPLAPIQKHSYAELPAKISHLIRHLMIRPSIVSRLVKSQSPVVGSLLTESLGYSDAITVPDPVTEVQPIKFRFSNRYHTYYMNRLIRVEDPARFERDLKRWRIKLFFTSVPLSLTTNSIVAFRTVLQLIKNKLLRKLSQFFVWSIAFSDRVLSYSGKKLKLLKISRLVFTVNNSHISSPYLEYGFVEPRVLGEFDCVTVIAFQGRHQALGVVVEALCDERLGTKRHGVVLACDAETDLFFCQELHERYENFSYLVVENNPLGRKWQLAVECARSLNPRYLAITGSDDLMTQSYLENNMSIMDNSRLGTIAMSGPRTWYVVSNKKYLDSNQESTVVVFKLSYKNTHHLMPLGAGRIYSRGFLEANDWKVFDCNLDRLLDDQGYESCVLQNETIYNTVISDGVIVSIKGAWGAMNPLSEILKANSIVTTELSFQELADLINLLGPSWERVESLLLS
jgi:hypothetical protein